MNENKEDGLLGMRPAMTPFHGTSMDSLDEAFAYITMSWLHAVFAGRWSEVTACASFNLFVPVTSVIEILEANGFKLVATDDGDRTFLFATTRASPSFGSAALSPAVVTAARYHNDSPANPHCTVAFVGAQHLHEKFKELAGVPPREDFGKVDVAMLVQTMTGYSCNVIGKIGAVPLEKENYSRATVEDFGLLVNEFKKQQPFGRLAVVDGPPGTGKSHLVRSLMAEMRPSKTLLVPVELIAKFSTPGVLVAIHNWNIHGSHAPLLVIEDADAVIAPRAKDRAADVSALSTLLNITDGILGDISDLRIIVTTNAAKTELDPALLRPGRLYKQVTIPYLEPAHAMRVCARLGRPRELLSFPVTLAECYAWAVGGTA